MPEKGAECVSEHRLSRQKPVLFGKRPAKAVAAARGDKKSGDHASPC
jgi:hypothetical protein